jgi:hypothetical protein
VDIGGLEGTMVILSMMQKKQNKDDEKFSKLNQKSRFYLENSIKFVNGLIKKINFKSICCFYLYF